MLKRKENKGQGWGGQRPNQTGRPQKHGQPTIRRSLRIPVILDQEISEWAESCGLTHSEYIVQLLLKFTKEGL